MTKQSTATVFAAGETPQMWVDGVKNPLAVTPGTPTGTLNVTDVLELGRGNRPTNPPIGYFKGRCSFFGLSSTRQPDEVLETITMAFHDPPQVYGHGTVNLRGDAIRSPVAMVVRTTSTPGAPVTVDVGAASYDPAGLPLTCTAATIYEGAGNITRSGGNVTITPASNAVVGSLVAVEYTIANSSGKTSKNRIYLVVSGVVIPAVQATNNAYTATVGVTAPYSPLSDDTPSTGVTITLLGTPSAGGTATRINNNTQISYTPRSTPGTETVSYTMSDGRTFASAVITFTVSAAAVAVEAKPDAYNATAGVQQDYSPLDNDVGTGLRITNLGTLTGGSTRSIINNATQVRYTPHASTTDYSEGLTYTIADDKTPPGTATGAITFSVTGVAVVVPADRPKIPPATGFVRPATRDTFAAVYAAANSGDQIICADGNYTFTAFNRTFGTTDATAVVIRAASLNGAVFTGKIQNASGRGHWFHELRFTFQGDSDSNCSVNAGRYSWFTRCWFTSPSAILAVAEVGGNGAYLPFTNMRIGYCRFNGSSAGAVHTHAFVKLMKYAGGGTNPTNQQFSDVYVYRNYFCDAGATMKHYIFYVGDAHVFDGLYGNKDEGDAPLFSPVYVEENYVSSNNKRGRFCYLKNGITGVFRNHVAASSDDCMSQRHGYGTKWYGNRTPVNGGWIISGGGRSTLRTEYKRNVCVNMDVYWGCAQSATAVEFYAGDWSILWANTVTGKITLGEPNRNFLRSDAGGIIDHLEIYGTPLASIDRTKYPARFDNTCVFDAGNPKNITNPPEVAGVTDTNGTVLSTWNGTKTGLETGNQD